MKINRAITAISIAVMMLSFFNYAPLALAAKTPAPTWTFMVYLDCDNNLDTFGPINLQQMSNGLTAGADDNIVVLMDRLNLPAYVYLVTHEEITTVKSLGEVDMGSPETLTWFINFTVASFPAVHYFLDMWDHGGGYAGTCWDESSGNHLTPHQVETAIVNAESASGTRIDVVGFDACLMGMAEVAYELKDTTDIVIGSEMLTPGYGWPYAQLMTYLSVNPSIDPKALSIELVNEYIASYPKVKVQLSAIDEASISGFAESLDNFANILTANVDIFRNVVAGARSDAEQKLVLGTQGSSFFVDLAKFAALVSERTHNTNIVTANHNLQNNLTAMIFAQSYNPQQGNLDKKEFGLTINFPPNRQAYNPNYETNVPDFTQETAWLTFLNAFFQAK